MKIERKVYDMNGSLAIPIPYDVAKFLELDAESVIVMEAKEKSKGKFLAVWSKKEDKEK